MILVDIDGVCLDLLGAIHDRNPLFVPDMVRAYDFSEGNYGISQEEVMQYIVERETFELMQPYRGVQYGLNMLSTLDTLKAWTYVPEYLADIRTQQIIELGFTDFCVSVEYPKPMIVQGVWAVIEDNPQALEAYKGTGVIRIMVRRSYNIKYKDADYTVAGLKEAYTVLRKVMVATNANKKSIFDFRSKRWGFFGGLS